MVIAGRTQAHRQRVPLTGFELFDVLSLRGDLESHSRQSKLSMLQHLTRDDFCPEEEMLCIAAGMTTDTASGGFEDG
jgi:hypothetical protein